MPNREPGFPISNRRLFPETPPARRSLRLAQSRPTASEVSLLHEASLRLGDDPARAAITVQAGPLADVAALPRRAPDAVLAAPARLAVRAARAVVLALHVEAHPPERAARIVRRLGLRARVDGVPLLEAPVRGEQDGQNHRECDGLGTPHELTALFLPSL